jgi:hypothetical protein
VSFKVVRRGSHLKKLAKRIGSKKAKVALTRKIAAILHAFGPTAPQQSGSFIQGFIAPAIKTGRLSQVNFDKSGEPPRFDSNFAKLSRGNRNQATKIETRFGCRPAAHQWFTLLVEYTLHFRQQST